MTHANVSISRQDALDPITVEVIGNSLASIAEEMGKVLLRAAYSDTVKIREDASTALFDNKGRVIVQAEHIPLHLGSLIGIIEHIHAFHDVATIRPGDAFIGNDPYVGSSTHLPDIVIAEPVFHGGEIIAWAVNTAHHTDFIDRSHQNIFSEGLRIPPVRLYREGVLQEDLRQLILLNCQFPHLRDGDLRAQMAANRLGVQRLTALIERYGIDTILGTFEELLDYAERKTRAGIGRIPDGHYEFSGLFDTDLIDDVLRLRVAIDISGDEMRVDFAGNPPQMRAGVNAILNATRAMVYMTVRSLIDPDTPINAGVYRPIVISAPEGCIFNATAPAAVNSREDTVRQIPDMIRLALADVIPEKIQAASNGGGSSTRYGMNPRTGEPYVYGETIGCGHGARATKDGLDGVQFYPTNSANVPIEILEATQPLQVECYELVQDSGGAGKFRGGLGVRRRLKAIAHDCRVRIGNTSNIHGPRGVLGGRDGATALVEMDEGLLPLVHRTGLIEPGKWVGVVTAGGGGYGDPKLRARDDILRDLREERISLKAAREVYGYTETD